MARLPERALHVRAPDAEEDTQPDDEIAGRAVHRAGDERHGRSHEPVDGAVVDERAAHQQHRRHPGEEHDGEDRLLPRRLVVLVRLTQCDEHLTWAPQDTGHTPPPEADKALASSGRLVRQRIRDVGRLQVRAHRASVPSFPVADLRKLTRGNRAVQGLQASRSRGRGPGSPRVTCTSCGTTNEAGRKFCKECGSALAVTCASCAAANAPDSKFCGECGAALTASVAPPAPTVAGPTQAERRLVSVLFADLVGYTALSEGRDFEDVRELLTRYFDAARTVIERYGGTVEKFIGDAVMALWGAPVARRGRRRACRPRRARPRRRGRGALGDRRRGGAPASRRRADRRGGRRRSAPKGRAWSPATSSTRHRASRARQSPDPSSWARPRAARRKRPSRTRAPASTS